MTLDPDSFAHRVNYLAALGRLVVPRAFAFAGRRVLFVGHEPFDAEELGGLLPDGTEWHEHQYAPEWFEPDVAVLGRAFPEGTVEFVLRGAGGSPKVVPQEGFLDELLFGHDWWSTKREALREMVASHRGLRAAGSVGALSPVGVEGPQPVEKSGSRVDDPSTPDAATETVRAPGGISSPPSAFSWPSTEAKETRGGGEGDYDLRARSRLKELGYDTTKPPSARWRILRRSRAGARAPQGGRAHRLVLPLPQGAEGGAGRSSPAPSANGSTTWSV